MEDKGRRYGGLALRGWSSEVVYQKPSAIIHVTSKIYAV